MLVRPDITTVAKPTPIRQRQTTLTFIVVAAAILWCVFHSIRGDQSIYNPGHLTMVHKELEQQCSRCHDDAQGSFVSQRVSDTACLQCHDRAIHDVNQKFASGHSTKLAMAASAAPGQFIRSSNCTACHMEHRGMDLLNNKTDSACKQCHDHLQENAINKIVCPESTTAFVKDQHPDFGRELMQNGKAVDPTVLKYNHRVHTKLPVGKGKPDTTKCATCHVSSQADPGYMAPVSYDAVCVKCHELSVLASPALSAKIKHPQTMEQLRAELAQLPADYLAVATDPQNQPTILPYRYQGKYSRTGLVNPDLAPSVDKKISAAYAKEFAAKPQEFMPVEQFVQNQLDKMALALKVRKVIYPQAARMTAALKNAHSTTLPSSGPAKQFRAPDQNLLEYYVVFEANNRCVLCHDVKGDLPAVLAKDSSQTLLTTVPTKVPRALFSNARFNHDKHSKDCSSCHESVDDSIADRGLDKNKNPLAWDKSELAETSRLLVSTDIESCTKCHNPPGSPNHTASSNCQECHSYHDRRLEQAAMAASIAGRTRAVALMN